MKVENRKVEIIDSDGKKWCDYMGKAKTIKGITSDMAKTSIAFTKGCKIRIEYTIQ